MIRIPEIELCFSNACTANCFICSRTHGGYSDPFMSRQVFDTAKKHMHDIDFDILQTGGDGDAFLNPIYLDALRDLRREFPKEQIVLYSNFALLTPDITDILIGENLINDLFTRVDSVLPEIFKISTGLDMELVFSNIDYFLTKNKRITFQINYSNIKRYRENCRKELEKEPYQWSKYLDLSPDDEYEAVRKRFCKWDYQPRINTIRRTLWAERNDPEIKPEPNTPCQRTYCFQNVCYVWPTGNVGICGYDDGQDAMIIGNVLEESIASIWNGERRKKMIEHVTGRGIKGYPCINPKACLFY
jgi:Iron-sulfur cluster-binding domain